jgi:hypothetical protein
MARFTKRVAALAVLACVIPGCGAGFKQAVQTWTRGEGYKGAVLRVRDDAELDDTSRRLELMNLSGLACTVDEDEGKSTPESPSAACKCSLPTGGGDTQAQDCKTWADAL